MAIIQDPGSPQAPLCDQYVTDVMQLLDRMTPVNPCANEGLESLKYMRKRYLQGIAEGKAEASPEASLSNMADVSLQDNSRSSVSSFQTLLNSSPVESTASTAASSVELAPVESNVPVPTEQENDAFAPDTSPLFNAFFSPNSQPKAPAPAGDAMDYSGELLFTFDPMLPVGASKSTWLTEPVDPEAWPPTGAWLEGELDSMQWQRALGF